MGNKEEGREEKKRKKHFLKRNERVGGLGKNVLGPVVSHEPVFGMSCQPRGGRDGRPLLWSNYSAASGCHGGGSKRWATTLLHLCELWPWAGDPSRLFPIS